MIICVCNNISDRQIRDVIDRGACSMADIQAQLPVSSQCGTCFESAEQVLFECLRSAKRNPGLFYNAA
ncbi:MAG: bacterioferritin-associated ferredoxin [Pseudomonadales bacterium]